MEIKIKSKIDVITNSSTEVFIIKTTKSADDIFKEFKDIFSEEYWDIEYRDLNTDPKSNRPTTNPLVEIMVSDIYEDVLEYIEQHFEIVKRTHW